jgi:inosine-uridine nucleoside N-ribohydrolase
VAVGPLTNVALAMVLDPAFATGLKDLVIMGGVFAGTTGSTEMPGEFNVWSDPEAVRIVLDSGVVARLGGLDVTRQVRLTRAEAQLMAADPHRFVSFAGPYSVGWIDHLAQTRTRIPTPPRCTTRWRGGGDSPGTADVRRRPARRAPRRGGSWRADRRPAPRPDP